MADIDFEEQLEQERIAKDLEEARKENGQPQTRTDPDGTEYEWDVEKKAWFPKIDADFIAKYQMKYGESVNKDGSKEGCTSQNQEDADYVTYVDYYQNYYQAAAKQEQLMNKKKKAKAKKETHEETMEKLTQLESRMQQGDTGADSVDSASYSKEDMEKYTDEEKKQYNDYWSYYYQTEHHDYYSDCMSQYEQEGQGETERSEGHGQEDKDQDKDDSKKKGKKRKVASQPERPEGWFEVDESTNTNVYVSNLPLDITDDEFHDLMSKYGLVMYDPRTKKPKLKLYRDDNGQPKGDGRCCYIKRESVDLALDILDGNTVRGHNITVKQATFQMKGEFDSSKKKKKLTNKEKKKMKEKQAKLFDWRPEQPGSRPKHEKVVILKNMFDPKSFEENPLLINSIRDDVRAECLGFGEIKKIIVYDRQPDGVISVAYKEAEEADLAMTSLNHRWFAQRRIIASKWDGNAKYEVEETGAEREARLNKWQTFLEWEHKDAKNPTIQLNENTPDTGLRDQSDSDTDILDKTKLNPTTSESSSINVRSDNTTHNSGEVNTVTTQEANTLTTEFMETADPNCDQGIGSEISENNT